MLTPWIWSLIQFKSNQLQLFQQVLPPALSSFLSPFPTVAQSVQSFSTAVSSEHSTVCVCVCCQVHWWQSISIWATAQYNYRGILRIALTGLCVYVCVVLVSVSGPPHWLPLTAANSPPNGSCLQWAEQTCDFYLLSVGVHSSMGPSDKHNIQVGYLWDNF